MYQLYNVLKNRTAPPTDQEKAIASKSSNLSNAEIREFVGGLVGSQKQTIAQAFERQSMVCSRLDLTDNLQLMSP
jgi:hypothetical protein